MLVLMDGTAGFVAWRQLGEAQNARIVSTYTTLYNAYSDIITSLNHLRTLEHEHQLHPGDESLSQYVNRRLSEDGGHLRNDAVLILHLFEYIGTISREALIEPIRIINFMGGSILLAERCLIGYIESRIEEEKNQALYANTRWIMTELHKAIEKDQSVFRFEAQSTATSK